ncbi:hypothetical protein HBA54_28480 [Pelagibius litoralis]|uniref:Uncharacterized protein n=1 Tax=Pelagibius litoralis TaxID=374515 RepID=A0A967F478_9PROT|nr:hypothetical protein [Pelagibius litoralis]NIA72531.1 hypothetical protein [Pelagibius litoralis]
MAYDAKHLTLMAHGAGQQWWSYRTADTPVIVDSSGYFTGEAVGMLKIGDLIFVQQVDNAAAPGSVTAAGWHLVLSNDGSVVDVSNATAVSTADTD